jgi:formamidopyrimidine-DNA glycosylase
LVYGRSGAPCRRCRQGVQRIVQGGRSTYLCPRCQPAR